MTAGTYLHYGVRYPSGYVADFAEDRDTAIREYKSITLKGGTVELVARHVGAWKRSIYQPPAARNAPVTSSDTASDRGRPGDDTEGNR